MAKAIQVRVHENRKGLEWRTLGGEWKPLPFGTSNPISSLNVIVRERPRGIQIKTFIPGSNKRRACRMISHSDTKTYEANRTHIDPV